MHNLLVKHRHFFLYHLFFFSSFTSPNNDIYIQTPAGGVFPLLFFFSLENGKYKIIVIIYAINILKMFVCINEKGGGRGEYIWEEKIESKKKKKKIVVVGII